MYYYETETKAAAAREYRTMCKAEWHSAIIAAINRLQCRLFLQINDREEEIEMNRDHDTSNINWLLGGLALGALAMFLMDPDRGRRRRALAKDKMHSATVQTRKRIDAKSRDLANRAKGLQAEARHILSGRDDQDDGDDQNRPTDTQPSA